MNKKKKKTIMIQWMNEWNSETISSSWQEDKGKKSNHPIHLTLIPIHTRTAPISRARVNCTCMHNAWITYEYSHACAWKSYNCLLYLMSTSSYIYVWHLYMCIHIHTKEDVHMAWGRCQILLTSMFSTPDFVPQLYIYEGRPHPFGSTKLHFCKS